MPIQSTRFKLLIVAIVVAIAKEVAAFYDVQIPTETFLTVQGMILGLMGLDTARPLGRGYPPDDATEVVEVKEDPA